MAAYGGRIRNVRLSKSIRRRRDSDEEPVIIDFNRSPSANIQDFLWRACQREGVSRGQRLAYLNALVKVFSALDVQRELFMTREELIYCLRVPLLNETKEVRAAGYRALRYLIRVPEDVRSVIRFQIPVLMVRSLDLILDNPVERLQSLRLARRLLAVCPALFPADLTRCLLAIAADGPLERDKLWMITVATLTQLSISNCELLAACGGVHVLLRCVLDCYQPRVVDAVLSALFGLMGRPPGFWPDLSLLLAPLADPHYGHHACEPDSRSSDQASREEVLRASQVALLSVLRSWPGLLLLSSRHEVALRALLDSLHVDRPELRRALIDVLYELLGREPPDPSKPPDVQVREFLAGGVAGEACKLYEGFVAEEARWYLPHLGDTRPNLVMNHTAVLLYILLENGVLEGLVEVVVTADQSLSLAATMLIGDILHQVNEILPTECARFSNCLPTLLSRAAQCGPTERTVTEAISLLSRLHAVRRRQALYDGASPFFRQQMLFCSMDDPAASDIFEKAVKENKGVRVTDACVQSLLAESRLLSSEDSATWDWHAIHCLVKLSASQHGGRLCPALARLCSQLSPGSEQYWRLPAGRGSELQTLVLADLIGALLDIDTAVCGTCGLVLDSLVASMAAFLQAAASAGPDSAAQISANSLINTTVQYHFLLLGRVSSTARGRDLLDRHAVGATLLQLTAASGWDYYVKLVVSSLDYSTGPWAWAILEKCLLASEEAKRLYCTLFLRLLARARCPGFSRWGVELLVGQLYDQSERVAAAALVVVEEVCDYEPYLKSVVREQPSVLSLGDGGVMLFTRLLSVPDGHKMFQRANFLDHELDRWRDGFNARYVSLVEAELNDSLTRHQRSASGGYGRRTGDRHQTRPVHLPHHLYGQLSHHRAGFDLVRSRPEVTDMIRVVKQAAADMSTTPNLHQLKTALWALSNVGRTGLGAAWLWDAGLVAAVAALAAGSASLAVRATACLALGLLGSTPQGAAALASLGWQSVCRTWTERWAVEEEKLDPPEDRADVLSVSSGSSYDVSAGGRLRTISQTSEPLSVGEAAERAARSATLPTAGRAVRPPAASAAGRHARSLSDAAREPSIPEFSAWTSPPPAAAASSTESLSAGGGADASAAALSPIASFGSLGELPDEPAASGVDGPAAGSSAPLPAAARPRLPSVSLSLSPPSVYPSEEDAQGYATLRGLSSRRRGDAAEEARAGSGPLLDVGRRRLASLTLDARLSRTMSAGTPSPAGEPPPLPLLRGTSRRSSLTTVKRYQLQRGGPAPAYLGIALPLELRAGLLTPPPPPPAGRRLSEDSEPEPSSKEASLSVDDDGVLEFHNSSNCLRCFTLKDRAERRPRNRTDTESSTESSQHVSSPPQPESYLAGLRPGVGGGLDIPSSITSVGSATSVTSNDQILGPSRPTCIGHVRSRVRRELLRFVGSLSTSVGVRAAEQGLLCLKQEFSGLLRTDLCLYCDIHQILATYNFRLSSRRFLQELFEDLMFEDVKAEALWLLSRCRQERLDQTFDTEAIRDNGSLPPAGGGGGGDAPPQMV